MDPITKEKFLEVYNKHLPNKWTKFAFKYFSLSTKETDRWVSQIFAGILISLFIAGFIGIVANFSKLYTSIITLIMIVLLLSVSILLFGAVIMNNFRIRKIRKILGLSRLEYNAFANLYL